MSAFFLKIVNMSISASWLLLVVLLLRLVLKRAPKWVSVLLWGLVAVRLICPLSPESVFSLIPSAETVSPEILLDRTPEISTGIRSLDTVLNPIITKTFAPDPAASANPLQLLIPAAGIFWLVGIAAMLLYTAISYFLLRKKVATAVLLKNNIYQSENVGSPFVLGILKPNIYLPFQIDRKNWEHVIAHEQAHIRRRDHWWKPFGFTLLALHWFNPLMWLGYILLCRDIELACDEKVIKEMSSETKADYSQALVACSVGRRSIAACPLAFGEVGVKERVRSVMNYKKPVFWMIVAAVVICLAAAVCFLTDPISSNTDLQSDQYYLRIGTGGIYEVEISMPGTSGGCVHADGSVFKTGEQVWLELLSGVEDIRGLRIRALDKQGTEKYRFVIPADATADQITELLAEDDWLTVPAQAVLADPENDPIEKTYHENTDRTESVIVDGKLFLDSAVTDAILVQNAGDRFPDGLINTEAHSILGIETKSGTPLVGQTNHTEEVTLYIQYVYNRYAVSDGKPEPVGGVGTPAVLTFSGDPQTGYTLKEFWEPEGGAHYTENIRSKFPEDIADMLLNSNQIEAYALKEECLKKAEEYLASSTS